MGSTDPLRKPQRICGRHRLQGRPQAKEVGHKWEDGIEHVVPHIPMEVARNVQGRLHDQRDIVRGIRRRHQRREERVAIRWQHAPGHEPIVQKGRMPTTPIACRCMRARRAVSDHRIAGDVVEVMGRSEEQVGEGACAVTVERHVAARPDAVATRVEAPAQSFAGTQLERPLNVRRALAPLLRSAW